MAAVICEKCSKEVRPEKRGSMTQWVFDDSSCSCHKASLSVAQEETKNKICPKCFNFKTSRRSGSMTQWIFRRYQCNCADESESQRETSLPQTTSNSSEFAGEPQSEEDFGSTEFPFNIERYKPLNRIAKSINSVVYKCFDRQLGRIVAIKTLMFIDSAALINFQQEARATGHLKHPNIVEVLDFGIGDGGAAYMILEFVEAIDLDDWITKKGQFAEADAIGVIGEVCKALDFAHRKGIFHRDLKPQNILITADREIKLIDFGLALVVNPEKNISNTKGLSLAGTPSYMSPDQFLGRPYDARSEIYSLGCVLFFCLTGRPPFLGETALEIARAHADAPVPPLEEACPGTQFSERVRHVVEHCLEKDASLRYSSISSLATDLKVELNQPQSDNTKQSASIFVSNDGMQLVSDRPEKTIWQKFNRVLKQNALPIFFSVFGLAVLTVAVALIIFSRTEDESVRFPEFHSTVMNTPAEKDPILLQNDNKTLSTLDDKLSSQYTAYRGKRADFSALLGEADQSIMGENPSNSELYFSLDSYNECIGKLTKYGPLKPPDRVMTRALLGSYKANLKLRRYDELPGLEEKILQYCPSGDQAEYAYHLFEGAASSYTKRKKPREALRCMEAALEAWKKTPAAKDHHYTSLELNIGTTYLELGEWKKAKQWLDTTLVHIEKSAPNREFNIACLIRLGVANQNLKDYKTAYQKFRAAEKMVLKPRDEFSDKYIGQLYYRWAIALHEEGKLEEAESKLVKGIAAERETRSQLALQSFLGTIRKELGSETKRK